MKLSWKKTLAVWWSLAWRGTLLGMLFGAVLGGVTGGVLGAQNVPLERIRAYGVLAGYVGGFIASIIALKLALEKHLFSLAAIAATISAGEGTNAEIFPEG